MRKEILIKNSSEIQPRRVNGPDPYTYNKYEVTPRKDFDQCHVAMYRIPPMKSNYPMHAHENNTEVFYIISGKGLLETPEGSRAIGSGDFIVCPPGAASAHKLSNNSETEDLVYIDFDTVNSPDVVYYPDSDKTGVIIHNKSAAFFKNDSEVYYYEGE